MVATLATSSVQLATPWLQNASASLPKSIIANSSTADVDVEEAAVAENTTSRATNKATSENTIGANSTR